MENETEDLHIEPIPEIKEKRLLIGILVSKEEKANIVQNALTEGKSVSEYIRWLIGLNK